MPVHYKQPTDDRTHNGEPSNGGYSGAVVPVVPVPMIYGGPMNNPMYSSPMYSSPMYGSVPDGYSSEPNMYISRPSTTETPNLDSNGHKAKAHLRKHKHKPNNHSKYHKTRHHTTGKTLSTKVDQK